MILCRLKAKVVHGCTFPIAAVSALVPPSVMSLAHWISVPRVETSVLLNALLTTMKPSRESTTSGSHSEERTSM